MSTGIFPLAILVKLGEFPIMEVTRENLLMLIDKGMNNKSLGVRTLENEAGVPKDTVRDFIRGRTQILRADKLQKIMQYLGSIPELRISGIMEKSAEIIPVPLEQDEIVDCPAGFIVSDLSVIRIGSDAMHPVFYEGWLVYYSQRDDLKIPFLHNGAQIPYPPRENDDTLAEYLGRPSIIRLADGRMMLRTLKRGSVAGRYHLIAYNAQPVEDAEVEWAARIVFIKTI
jgi:hypothetical protein